MKPYTYKNMCYRIKQRAYGHDVASYVQGYCTQLLLCMQMDLGL